MRHYLLTRAVARALDVSERTVRNWEAEGKLKAIRASGRVRLFDARQVERLRQQREERLQTEEGVLVGSERRDPVASR